MKLEFFTIPIRNSREAGEELNRFLASHRVVTVDRQFIGDGANSAWAICVTIQDGGPSSAAAKQSDRIDYREVLSESDFRVYSKLRTLRKELAEKEGIPAYALFTNEQLADIVRQRVTSLTRLGELNGVGPARVEKYGESFLEIVRRELGEKTPAETPSTTQGPKSGGSNHEIHETHERRES